MKLLDLSYMTDDQFKTFCQEIVNSKMVADYIDQFVREGDTSIDQAIERLGEYEEEFLKEVRERAKIKNQTIPLNSDTSIIS
jgi:hypothetical protein